MIFSQSLNYYLYARLHQFYRCHENHILKREFRADLGYLRAEIIRADSLCIDYETVSRTLLAAPKFWRRQELGLPSVDWKPIDWEYWWKTSSEWTPVYIGIVRAYLAHVSQDFNRLISKHPISRSGQKVILVVYKCNWKSLNPLLFNMKSEKNEVNICIYCRNCFWHNIKSVLWSLKISLPCERSNGKIL